MPKMIFIGRDGCFVKNIPDRFATFRLPTSVDGGIEIRLFTHEHLAINGVEMDVQCDYELARHEILERIVNHLPNTYGEHVQIRPEYRHRSEIQAK